MKLDLNLIEKPSKSYAETLYWLMLIFFVCFTSGYAIYTNYQLGAELASKLKAYKSQLQTAKIKLDMQQRKSRNKPIPQEEIDELTQKITFINQLKTQQRFYWTEFLNYLEAEVPADVMITKIAPSPKTKQVIITGLAKTTRDIVNFLEEMQTSPHFSDVFLNKQEKFTYKVGDTNVRKLVEKFTLSFHYGKDEV